jgi:hypothetical protein
VASGAHRAGDEPGPDPTDRDDPHPRVEERDRDRAAHPDGVDDPRALEEQEVAPRQRPDREEPAAAFASSLRDEEHAAASATSVARAGAIANHPHRDPSHPTTFACAADVESVDG